MKMPSGLPKDVARDYMNMVNAVIKFTDSCKKHAYSPERCYSAVAGSFMIQFDPKETPYVRDIVAEGTNHALETWQKYTKNS